MVAGVLWRETDRKERYRKGKDMADIQLQTLDSTANIDHIYGYATSPQEPSTALAIDHYPGALADFTQVKIQSPGLDELYLSSPVASPTPTFARQFDIVSGSTAQVLGDFQVGTLGPQNVSPPPRQRSRVSVVGASPSNANSCARNRNR